MLFISGFIFAVWLHNIWYLGWKDIPLTPIPFAVLCLTFL